MASVSHSFVLQWTLKEKDKKEISKPGPSAPFLRSDLYHIKSIQDFYFYLELKRNSTFESVISIKGSKTWSFKLSHAFLATKDRVFNLKASKDLLFLNSFRPDHVLDEAEVAIHCFINAYLIHPAPDDIEEILSIKKGQNMVALEDMPSIHFPSDYENGSVINFIRYGEVPNFNPDTAIEIISETEYHKCELLKTLCAEFLLNNMFTSNLQDILRTAIDYDLPLLARACSAQIAYGSYEIKETCR